MLRIILNVKKYDPKYFFQRSNQKVQEPSSIDYINCSKTNAAYIESLITTTRRATQRAGNIVDSHSATTLSIHDEMLFMSGALGAEGASGSASSSLKFTIILTPGSASSRLSGTSIVSIDRMMLLPREDALLLSSESFFQISLRTSTLEKMRMKIHGAFVLFFLFLFNYFFINLSS